MSGEQTIGGARVLKLRGYERSDLDAMFLLDEICFEAAFRFTKRAMRHFAEAGHAQVLLAENAGELAGFSIVHVEHANEGPEAYLLTLDVAPAFRRRGVATGLMERAEREAREAGCRAMLLHVFTGNTAAIAMYEAMGYTRLGAAENFYGKGAHAWVYRKPLFAASGEDR